jgi:hypothetical protein
MHTVSIEGMIAQWILGYVNLRRSFLLSCENRLTWFRYSFYRTFSSMSLNSPRWIWSSVRGRAVGVDLGGAENDSEEIT